MAEVHKAFNVAGKIACCVQTGFIVGITELLAARGMNWVGCCMVEPVMPQNFLVLLIK